MIIESGYAGKISSIHIETSVSRSPAHVRHLSADRVIRVAIISIFHRKSITKAAVSTHMKEPTPTTDWPDDPLSVTATKELLQDTSDAIAIWVMDHDESVRRIAIPDASPDAIVDIVIETTTGFDMYSYTDGQWMDYGTQQKDNESAPSMAGTLASYRVLAGASELTIGGGSNE